ncbi:unnamed protein product [Lymnaea stagnalis]|uniref:LITAF domain-containing protein n=1 Tax=Lymnaea stagnalis TaxID=6523 RepID=A0AAV2ING7_LYMST
MITNKDRTENDQDVKVKTRAPSASRFGSLFVKKNRQQSTETLESDDQYGNVYIPTPPTQIPPHQTGCVDRPTPKPNEKSGSPLASSPHKKRESVVVKNRESFAKEYEPPRFHKVPVHIQCTHCGNLVYTATEKVRGNAAWTLCCMLVLTGCCLIPLFHERAQDTEHRCPRCHKVLGKYKVEIF